MATGPSANLPSQYGLETFRLDEIDSFIDPLGNEIFLGSSPTNQKITVEPILAILGKVSCEKTLVLDNWVNYESRLFGTEPDSVLVFDSHAREYACRIFTQDSTNVRQAKNYYIEESQQRFILLKKEVKNILFIEVPFNQFTTYSTLEGSSYCICRHLLKLCKDFPDHKIIYRSHPSGDSPDCFTKFGLDFPGYASRVELSNNLEIIEDFAVSEFVVGLPSYALFLAQELGLRAYVVESTNGNWHGPKFNLL
ncbi:MAG: hypothetical protein WCQ44_04505 [Opitutaceae bacterium]